jgi:hypothetical protein
MTTTINALRVDTDGTPKAILIDKDKFLDDMYRELECRLVECVSIAQGLDMWVDEEFLYADKQINNVASHLSQRPIMGSVVFLGIDNVEGESISLDKVVAERLLLLCATSIAVEQI